MSELDRMIKQLVQEETEHQKRMREWREQSSQRSQEFIDTMTAGAVGKTALYVGKYITTPGPKNVFKERPLVTRCEYEFAGEGWVVTEPQSEGRDTHLIVLDTNQTYTCNLPGLREEDEKSIDRTPYVTVTTRPIWKIPVST